MSGQVIHLISATTLKVLCGATEFGHALVHGLGGGSSTESADCDACLTAAEKIKPRERPVAKPQPSPRALRAGDSLGRAGRVSQKGNAIEVARNRAMSPQDTRHATIEIAGHEHPHLVVTHQPPHVDVTLDPSHDDHRSLMHNDGKGETRPPEAWENEHAETRATAFASERQAMTRDLRRTRENLRLSQRCEQIERALLVIQTPRAQQRRETDARSAVTPEHAGPQGDGHGDLGHVDPAQIQRRLQMVRLHLEAIEEIVDEHHGRAHVSYDLMAPEDKDRLIIGPKFRGLSPEEVHAIRPELGKPKAIRFVRQLADQDPLGHPAKPREAAA